MPPVRRKRAQIERALKEAVLALRKQQAAGNIALQVPETNDLILVLRVDPVEARELEAMLASPGSSPLRINPEGERSEGQDPT